VEAGRQVGELRWSFGVARKNYAQFGGEPGTSPVLEMIGDQDFGEQRPMIVTKSPPATVKELKEAQGAAADSK